MATTASLSLRLICRTLRRKFPTVRQITTDDLDCLLKDVKQPEQQQQGKQVLILDARTEEEYSVSHLPRAVHVNHEGDLAHVLEKIRQENGTSRPLSVIAYCSVGYRASIVATRLEEELGKLPSGHAEEPISIYNLEGSLFKWANEGRPMEDNEGRKTNQAHPYSRGMFGLLLKRELHRWPEPQQK